MCKAGLYRYQTRYPEGFTVRVWSIRTGHSGQNGQQHEAAHLQCDYAYANRQWKRFSKDYEPQYLESMHEDTFPTHTAAYASRMDRDPSTLVNVSGKLRSAETHWEYCGHELSEEDPTNLDADLTKIVNLYNEGVRMPAPTEPVVPEPNPIEDDVTIAWGSGQAQQIVSNTLEDEVQELQNEEEFAIPNQNEDTVSDINETDDETGVAEPEIPTEELEHVELEQPPAREQTGVLLI
jgi:hypothetical protein